MIFTDDDLKQWKKTIASNGISIEIKMDEFKAIIARLEAAEDLISVSPKSGRDITSYWDAFDAWLKACGRSK